MNDATSGRSREVRLADRTSSGHFMPPPWWRKHSESGGEPKAPVRIFLAEDDDAMRFLVFEVLSAWGYEVTRIPDGRILRAYMKSAEAGRRPMPDLVISDVRMPGGSGLEVLEETRAVDWATPVILITAFPDSATLAEARRLGAVAVLDKPFDLTDLLELVAIHAPPI